MQAPHFNEEPGSLEIGSCWVADFFDSKATGASSMDPTSIELATALAGSRKPREPRGRPNRSPANPRKEPQESQRPKELGVL